MITTISVVPDSNTVRPAVILGALNHLYFCSAITSLFRGRFSVRFAVIGHSSRMRVNNMHLNGLSPGCLLLFLVEYFTALFADFTSCD